MIDKDDPELKPENRMSTDPADDKQALHEHLKRRVHWRCLHCWSASLSTVTQTENPANSKTDESGGTGMEPRLPESARYEHGLVELGPLPINKFRSIA